MSFSIVTPSFRQLDWLRLCAASVADQRACEFEHIVQDAGSEGNLAEWLKTRPQLRVFIEQDDGMYDAVNRGLRRATGDICAYLNCDEQYLPGALATADRFFREHPEIDVLFTDAILVDEGGNPLSYRRIILPERTHVRFAHLNTLTCSTFFRRRLMERGFFFDPAWKDIGDAIWVERLLRENIKMGTIAEPLAVFTFTGANRSTLPTASKEGASRKAATTAEKARRLAAIATHRMRKAFAGAYRIRDVAIDIYTLDSPSERQRRAARIGFGWPK